MGNIVIIVSDVVGGQPLHHPFHEDYRDPAFQKLRGKKIGIFRLTGDQKQPADILGEKQADVFPFRSGQFVAESHLNGVASLLQVAGKTVENIYMKLAFDVRQNHADDL